MTKVPANKIGNVVIIDPVGKKGGLDHYNDSLASSLKKLNIEVKVFSNYTSEFAEPVFKFRFGKSLLFIPSMIFSLMKVFKLLKASKPQFVILHLFKITKSSNSLCREVKKQNIKLIYILHDLDSLIRDNISDKEMFAGLQLADEIVVHNHFSSDLLLQKFPGVENKLTIIPHGNFLDIPTKISKQEAKEKLGLNNSSLKVLFFGMIKPSKGLNLLLQAMMKVNAQLIIAGRMRKKSTSDFNNQLSNLKKEDKLIADLNYISNEKRDLYFKSADIIVLPYRKIYQSGVMIMAMSYGIPVVASDLTPNLEFAGNIDCIEFFKDGDSIQLEEKINFLLVNEERREILKKNAYSLLEKTHNWNLIAERFQQILSR